MKSVERNFIEIQEKNPYWSSYTCFANTIKGQRLSKDKVRRWFHKLVDPDDYEKNEKWEIIHFLQTL